MFLLHWPKPYRPLVQIAMNDTTTRDPKQECDIHIAYLSETHKAFIEYSAKVTGFLLLAIGWYATSNEARSFLATTSGLAVLSAIAVLSAYALSVAASWVAYSGAGLACSHLPFVQQAMESWHVY